MSSQKIGPSSLASRARFCTGAVESSDSMLPTTGLVGGCGIGLKRLLDAIGNVSPAIHYPSLRAKRSNPEPQEKTGLLRRFAPRNDGNLPESFSTPFDQFGADLFRLFLLRPMTAVAHQIFFQIGNELLHAVGSGRRQHGVILGHDHQRRHFDGVIAVSYTHLRAHETG